MIQKAMTNRDDKISSAKLDSTIDETQVTGNPAKINLGGGVFLLPQPRFSRVIYTVYFKGLSVLFYFVGLLLLTACGGGGGNPTRPLSPAPTPDMMVTPDPLPPSRASDFRSLEYDGDTWHLAAVNAAGAYARLADRRSVEPSALMPGESVNIGIIDTGILSSHFELQGARISDKVVSPEDNPLFLPLLPDIRVYGSHGTSTSSVIVAQRGPSPTTFNFHGVAWGANLKMFAVQLGSGAPGILYMPVNLAVSGTNIEEFMEPILDSVLTPDEDIDITNMSFGFDGLIENYHAADLRTHMGRIISKVAQNDRTLAEKTLIVISASNDNDELCAVGTDNCNVAEGETRGRLDATSPALVAGLPALIPELRSHMVAVAATQRSGELAGFSNRCGIAARWCIAAPGQHILTAGFNLRQILVIEEGMPTRPGYLVTTDYRRLSGTSFAAPLVTGGLALVEDYFRDQLGAHETLQRLYITANRDGHASPDDPADHGGTCPTHLDTDGDLSNCELSSTHGWGVMDLDAALTPVGAITIVSGTTLDNGTRVSVTSSRLQAGAALGNALSSSLRGHQIAVFDKLGAPFWVDFNGFMQHAAAIDLGDRLTDFMQPEPELMERGEIRAFTIPGLTGGIVEMPFASTHLYVGFNQASWEFKRLTGHAAVAELSKGSVSFTLGDDAFQFSAFAATPALSQGGTTPERTTGILFSWHPQESPFKVRLGTLREFDRVLGTETDGAFGNLASELTFAGIGLQANFNDWHWQADAEIGFSNPDSSSGLVHGISWLSTSAFSIAGTHILDGGGQFRLSLSQPLRVEKGQLQLRIPTGRDAQRNVTHEMVDASLEPTGQQFDFTAEWHRPMQKIGGEMRLGAIVSFQPGHVVSRGPELMLMAGYRISF